MHCVADTVSNATTNTCTDIVTNSIAHIVANIIANIIAHSDSNSSHHKRLFCLTDADTNSVFDACPNAVCDTTTSCDPARLFALDHERDIKQ